MKTHISKGKGFSLLELLLVVALISILSAIALPMVSKYRASAVNTAAQSDLRILKSMMEAIFVEKNQYPAI